MNISSLGLRTEIIFPRFSGEVIDRGSYTVVRTPSNPGYHWGNFIVFDKGPQPGDLKRWTEIFKREFPYYSKTQHFAFTWTGDDGDAHEFVDFGFDLEKNEILSANAMNPPPRWNQNLQIRKLQSDGEWESAIQLQILTSDPKYRNDYFETFKRRQMANYRRMSSGGWGHWFGAFAGEKMVGDLGIFCEGELARYQNVGTHPEHRRQGVCGSLVYGAAQVILNEFPVKTLVMVADPEYHAAKIYKSVGFQTVEFTSSLSWVAQKAD